MILGIGDMTIASVNRYSCSDGNVQPVTPLKSAVVDQYLHGAFFFHVVEVLLAKFSLLHVVGAVYANGIPFEICHILVEEVVLDCNLRFHLRTLATRAQAFRFLPIFYRKSTAVNSYVGVKSVIGNYHLVTPAVRDVHGALRYIVMLQTWPLGRIKIRPQGQDMATSISCSEIEAASKRLILGARGQKHVKLGIEEA